MITLRPFDVRKWRVGDAVKHAGERMIVVYVGCIVVALEPATRLRRFWYWLRRECTA